MDNNNDIRELIRTMKDVRAKRHLSYQSIADACEQAGTPVAKSSVSRIFAEGSEEMNFRYETTLKPVAQFILGVDDPLFPSSEPVDQAESSDLIHELSRQRDLEVQQICEQYDLRIQEKVDEIRRLRVGAKYRTIAIVVMGTLLILFLAIVIAYLAWDLSHPAQGAFQWETAAFLH